MSEPSEAQRHNVEVVRAAVEAFGQGPESEELLALMDPQIEIFLPAELPNSGTFGGRDGYATWVQRWLDAWEGFSVEIARLEPVGERHVVSLLHQTATGRGSGIPVEMEIAFLWDVRGDAVAAMHIYPTRDEAVAVGERRERDSPD